MSETRQQIASNRKARFDYHLLEKFEAGIVLTGTEVKSLRQGRANLKDAYGDFLGDELWLIGLHISPYTQGGRENHEPERPRKLLLSRRELHKLSVKTKEKGLTIVPLQLYFLGGWAKVEIALAQGKRQYDKRHAIAERDAARALARAKRGERE